MADPSMFEVRVHFRNGTILSYAWRDMGAASLAKDVCTAAMRASKEPPKQPMTAANPGDTAWSMPAVCVIFDEGGHEAHLDGAEMMAVQMVDIEAESYMTTRAQIVAGRTRDDLLRKVGIVPAGEPTPNGRAAEAERQPIEEPSPGLIGRFAA
jgi:hypothetical protein